MVSRRTARPRGGADQRGGGRRRRGGHRQIGGRSHGRTAHPVRGLAGPADDVVSSDHRRGRAVDHAGSDHGALRVRGPFLRRRRVGVGHLRSPGAVDDHRAVRVLPGVAIAGAVHATHGVLRFRADHRDAGAGADPGNRQGSQRFPWVVRGRGLLDAALRADQDRLRDLGCSSAGRAAHGAGLAAGDAGPAGAGGGDRAGPYRRAARPGPDGVDGHHPAGLVLVRRPAAAGVPEFAGRRDRRGGHPGGVGGLPLRPGAVVAEPRPGHHRTRVTRPDRRSSRWPTAASSATVWARAPRSGTTCPTPTTTSSSRSSARSSAWSGRWACWVCSGCSPTPGCASRAGPPTRSCGC